MRPLVPILCNQAATLLLGLAGMKLISSLVPPAVNGAYGLFVALTQIGLLITHSGLSNHAMRYWPRERVRGGEYVAFLWSVSWRLSAWLVPILLVVVLGRWAYSREWIWLALLPFLILGNLAVAIGTVANGLFNADQSPWKVMILSVGTTLARTFVPVLIASATAMSLGMLTVGYTLHGAIVIGLVVGLARDLPPRVTPAPAQFEAWRRELRDYGRPFALLGVGAWLLQNVDRFIVERFFGLDQAGLFQLALGLGAILPTLGVNVFMQLFFPGIFARCDAARSAEDWRAIARRCDGLTAAFLALTLGGLVVLHAAAPWLVGPLISAKYAAAVPMVFGAGCALLAAQANQFQYLLLQGQHNSAGMVKVMLLVAGVKTAGSIAAAAVSWPVFLGWQAASVPLCAVLGRQLIRRLALGNDAGEKGVNGAASSGNGPEQPAGDKSSP